MIGSKTEWTDEKIKFLTSNIQTKTNKQLASGLGFTLTVVRNKIYELKLQRCKVVPWTEEEKETVKRLYKTTGDVEIAKLLCKTKKGVWKQRKLMKLERTVPEIQAIVAKNLEEFKKTSFKPGHKSTPNSEKAWKTRRKRDAMTTDQVIKLIEKREKCNFYRT